MNHQPFPGGLRKALTSVLSCSGAAALVLLASVAAWMSATHLEFNPVNGHFQNYDALRRVAAGQWPFSGFPAYLGAAALLLPFPLFEALGGTLAASNAAMEFVSVILLGASFVVTMRLCRWPAALAWPWAAALCAAPWPMARGNDSAIGIRSFLPFVVAAAMLALHRLAPRVGWKCTFAMAGAAAGAMPAWSNDYGLPCLGAFSVAVLASLDPGKGNRAGAWSLFVTCAMASLATVTTLLTGGHPAAWFSFNFGDVLGDQFWYYNPVARGKVYGLSDIPHGIGTAVAAVPNVIVWCWWATRRRRDPRHAALAALCAAAVGGAFLSGLAGTYELRYFMPLWRVTIVTLPFVAVGAASRVLPAFGRSVGRLRSDLFVNVVMAGAGAAIGAWFLSVTSEAYWRHPEPTDVRVAELGGDVPASYMPAILEARRLRAGYDAAGLPSDWRLLSTYSTAVSAVSGSMQDAPDYIIHALGERNRAAFRDALSEPYGNVETMDPAFLVWGLWNVRTSWDFYRELFTGWEPVSSTPWSIIWSRRAVPLPPGRVLQCAAEAVPDGSWKLAVTGAEDAGPTWVEVTADLGTRFSPGILPLVGSHRLLEIVESYDGADRSATRGMGVGGNVALVSNTWTLRLQDGPLSVPLRRVAGVPATLTLTAWPHDRASLSVRGCTAREVVAVAATEPVHVGERHGGRLLVAPSAGMPPPVDRYPARKDTVAMPLNLADPLAARQAEPGDEVVFPRGERGTVLLRDFGVVLVSPPAVPVGYPVAWVDVVPRAVPVTSAP